MWSARLLEDTGEPRPLQVWQVSFRMWQKDIGGEYKHVSTQNSLIEMLSKDAAHRVNYLSAITRFWVVSRLKGDLTEQWMCQEVPPSLQEGMPHGLSCLPIQYSRSWDCITLLWLLGSYLLTHKPLQWNSQHSIHSTGNTSAVKQSQQHGSRKCPVRLVTGGLDWFPWLGSEAWVTRAFLQG